MMISKLRLGNWFNFKAVDVQLGSRAFLVGPNAAGKSNMLDAFRFLRDVALPGGGLQKAVADRGGISKIRCLSAREKSEVEVDVTLSEEPGGPATWRYSIGIIQEVRGRRRTFLKYERVWRNERLILDRPNDEDRDDTERLSQTFLEQINSNVKFREIPNFLRSVVYVHLVPQLLRYPEAFSGPVIQTDPFGRGFLERIANTSKSTRESRLKKIQDALKVAVPQFKELTMVKDENGMPHLQAVYEHWRAKGAKQLETQFSDGTLRLIALLWSLLEGEAPLLLEEPELSLNAAIVSRLPSIFFRLQKARGRQLVVSTHSADLLSDPGIGGEEVIMLLPDKEGTKAQVASSIESIHALLEGGMSVGEAVLPQVQPKGIEQLRFF